MIIIIEIYPQIHIFSEIKRKKRKHKAINRATIAVKRKRCQFSKKFSLSPYNISIIQTKLCISANYIVTR